MSLQLVEVTLDNVAEIMQDFISEYDVSMHCNNTNNPKCPTYDDIVKVLNLNNHWIYSGFHEKKGKYVALIVVVPHINFRTTKVTDIAVNLLLIKPQDWQEFMLDENNLLMPFLDERMMRVNLEWENPAKKKLWGILGKQNLAASARQNKFLKQVSFDETFEPIESQKKLDDKNNNRLKKSYIFNYEDK